jgi:hypothetical protein
VDECIRSVVAGASEANRGMVPSVMAPSDEPAYGGSGTGVVRCARPVHRAAGATDLLRVGECRLWVPPEPRIPCAWASVAYGFRRSHEFLARRRGSPTVPAAGAAACSGPAGLASSGQDRRRQSPERRRSTARSRPPRRLRFSPTSAQARRPATSSASDGFTWSLSDRMGRPSGVASRAGQGTPTAGSSQAKPSSSLPSNSLVTR